MSIRRAKAGQLRVSRLRPEREERDACGTLGGRLAMSAALMRATSVLLKVSALKSEHKHISFCATALLRSAR